MPKFKVEVHEGITTGTLVKYAIIDAKSKEEAEKLVEDDGNVGPMIDWEEDYDVEFDTSPETYVTEID